MNNTLYEITDKYLKVLDNLEIDEETGEILNAEELDELSGAFEEKSEAVACYIKNSEVFIGDLKAEEANLAKRRKQTEKRIDYLKNVLTACLDAAGRDKVETTKVRVSFRKSVAVIQKARDSKTPVRFLITGTDLDCNIRMGIESFEYEERSGELGDLYYTIKLYEWKDTSPKKIVLPEKKNTPAKTQEPARAGKPEKKSKTYTVKKGDCLWNIAKKFYGKGSDYTKIYNANKGTIGKNPNLIYPGQVFTIP